MPSKCDKTCRACVYSQKALIGSAGEYWCEYILETKRRRPCPAGKGCTVRRTKGVKKKAGKEAWERKWTE